MNTDEVMSQIQKNLAVMRSNSEEKRIEELSDRIKKNVARADEFRRNISQKDDLSLAQIVQEKVQQLSESQVETRKVETQLIESVRLNAQERIAQLKQADVDRQSQPQARSQQEIESMREIERIREQNVLKSQQTQLVSESQNTLLDYAKNIEEIAFRESIRQGHGKENWSSKLSKDSQSESRAHSQELASISQQSHKNMKEEIQAIDSVKFEQRMEVIQDKLKLEDSSQLESHEVSKQLSEEITELRSKVQGKEDINQIQDLVETRDRIDFKLNEQELLNSGEQSLDEVKDKISDLEKQLEGYLDEKGQYDREGFAFLKQDWASEQEGFTEGRYETKHDIIIEKVDQLESLREIQNGESMYQKDIEELESGRPRFWEETSESEKEEVDEKRGLDKDFLSEDSDEDSEKESQSYGMRMR